VKFTRAQSSTIRGIVSWESPRASILSQAPGIGEVSARLPKWHAFAVRLCHVPAIGSKVEAGGPRSTRDFLAKSLGTITEVAQDECLSIAQWAENKIPTYTRKEVLTSFRSVRWSTRNKSHPSSVN
jgi:hypothetical protein